MKTILLIWDPSDSLLSEEKFINDMCTLEFGDFNWTLPEDSPARSGDNFVLLYNGPQRARLVMKGFFISEPVKISQKGLKVSLRPQFMLDPQIPAALPSLEDVPGIQPHELVDGMAISDEHSPTLLSFLDDFATQIHSNKALRRFIATNNRPVADIEDAIMLLSQELYDKRKPGTESRIVSILRDALTRKSEDEMTRRILSSLLLEEGITAGELREEGFREELVEEALREVR